MPSVRLAQPFDAFHGTLSNAAGDPQITTYSSRIAPGVARRWTKPKITESAHQAQIQSWSTSAARRYSTLSAALIADWNEAAAHYTRTNILGLEYALTGNTLYRLHYLYLAIFGWGINDNVGDYVTPSEILSISYCHFVASTDGGITPDKVWIWAVVPSAPDMMRGICRLSKPLGGAARQANTSECTMRDPVISQNAAWKSPGNPRMVFDIDVPGSGIAVGSRIGIHITPTNAALYPGRVYFARNYLVTL